MLVGESALELVECLWQQTQEHSDPIRIALLAAEASRRAAAACPTERASYERNAKTFERWAIECIDKATNEEDAMAVLLRPSRAGWGSRTIYRLAMDSKCKQFIGNRVVQDSVEEAWRGKGRGNAWLPRRPASSLTDILEGSWNILLFWLRLMLRVVGTRAHASGIA